jgi:fluoroquinolone transport system permease protein
MSVVMYVTSALLTVVAGALIGLSLPPWPALIAVGLAAAPAAPMFALLVAAVSNNKVQAFAYLKLFGAGPMITVGAYFLPEPWQWFSAIYPPYCASKAYWVAEAGGSTWPLWVFAALITSAIWVGVLQRVYLRAARR